MADLPVPPVSEESGQALAAMLVAQRQTARDADWPGMLRVSLDLLGAGHGHGVAIRSIRRSDAAQADAAMEMAAELHDGLSQLAARDNHGAQAQGIRDMLQGVDPALAARADMLLDQVAAGSIDAGPFDQARATAAALGQAPTTDLEAALCVAAGTRGLLGLVHWVVNSTDPRSPDLSRFGTQLSRLEQAHAELGEMVEAAEQALHAACLGGQTLAVETAAAALAATAQDIVVPAATMQAIGNAWVVALREAGRNGDAERIGRVLARGGLLLRRAIASATVAELLRLDLTLRDPSDAVTGLLDAGGAPFAAEPPNGRDTEIAHLGPDDDGEFVQVEGFVVAAGAVRESDGKLVGRMVVEDASSGASVEMSTTFLHPPHIGITLGCYVIAHGIYRTTSARLEGRPGVEVDALAPSALAQQSWQARLWFTAGRWLDVWRTNLNLCWSLGGHTAGPDDSEEPTRGAAELIYAPFAR